MGKFLLFLFIFFFLVRYVVPLVLRFVVGRFLQKQARRYGDAFGQQAPFGQPRPSSPPPAPGQVRVDYVPPKATKAGDKEFKGGEYVDFEEVK
ncbi:DUF4834 family protein [Hymenobacter aerilatus]|uniref:DUF4834 family protein n=1 Tax=Hymenobacter aerilatus TaxID=2932251 RepID=A0A8T9SVZ7_9BACT|nr:DUF4834 family protein [Hymenobacter aerilatus]UOR04400.1 DUF4834 family protein [Hymenobacter aerilatus]